MGRQKTRAPSDSSEVSSSSGSDYSGSERPYKRRGDGIVAATTRLRPRAARKNVVYQDVDSDIDDFLESDDEEKESSKGGNAEPLPVALYNTVEKFLARRVKSGPSNEHFCFPPPLHSSPLHIHLPAPTSPSNNESCSRHAATTVLQIPTAVEKEPKVEISSNLTNEKLPSPVTEALSVSDSAVVMASDSASMEEANGINVKSASTPLWVSASDDNGDRQESNEELVVDGLTAAGGKDSNGDICATVELEETGSIVTPSERGRPSSHSLQISVSPLQREITAPRSTKDPTHHYHRRNFEMEYEYLVKYHNVSYLHVEWLSEAEVQEAIAHDRPLRTRFNNFIKKLESGQDIPELELLDCVPERIVDCSDVFRALYPTKAAEIRKDDWTMYCLKIVDAVVCFNREHRVYGVPFLRPVEEDKDGAPNYYDVVKNPMDFSTVQTKLYLRQYETPQEFWKDVKLIFTNCSEYNAPRTDISTQCRVLEALFDKLYLEWAKMSRGDSSTGANSATTGSISTVKTQQQQSDDGLPFVPLAAPGLTVRQLIQHVYFKKTLKEPHRQILYLVKWKNRSYTEMSWELASDISDTMKISQYHRHVRVPEYIIDPRGPAYYEQDLQRKMLQETLVHVKAAKEYLLGNMAVSVQSLPQLSSGGHAHAAKERWSYNPQAATQPPEHMIPQHPLPHSGPPVHHHHRGSHGHHRQGPTTAAAAASAAADDEQRQAYAKRVALMMGGGVPPGLMFTPQVGLTSLSGGYHPYMGASQSTPWGTTAEMFAAANSAAIMNAGRFFGISDPSQRLVSTTTQSPSTVPSAASVPIFGQPMAMNPALFQMMMPQNAFNSFMNPSMMVSPPQVARPSFFGSSAAMRPPFNSMGSIQQPRDSNLMQHQQHPRPPSTASCPSSSAVPMMAPSPQPFLRSEDQQPEAPSKEALSVNPFERGVDGQSQQNGVPESGETAADGFGLSQERRSESAATCEGGRVSASVKELFQRVTEDGESVKRYPTDIFKESHRDNDTERGWQNLKLLGESGQSLTRLPWTGHQLTTDELLCVLPMDLRNRVVQPPSGEAYAKNSQNSSPSDLIADSRTLSSANRESWCEGGSEESHNQPPNIDTDGIQRCTDGDASIPSCPSPSIALGGIDVLTTSLRTVVPLNEESVRLTREAPAATESLKQYKALSIDELSAKQQSKEETSQPSMPGKLVAADREVTTVVGSTDGTQLDSPLVTGTPYETKTSEFIKREDRGVQPGNPELVPQAKVEDTRGGELIAKLDPTITALQPESPPQERKIASRPPLDRSRPATFAANSVYAEEFARMKKPKPPPIGITRHYPVSAVYKGGRQLFDYQLEGLNWLLDLWASGNNGVLADEMGLGKTVQTMALLWHLFTKEKYRGPFLVVAPLSTLDHWKRTGDDWTDFNTVLYYDEGGRAGRDALRRVEWYHYMLDYGQRRQVQGVNGKLVEKSNPRIIPTYHYKFQLLLTSYEIFASDADLLVTIPWQFVVVDEAHRLKNRLSKTLHILKQVACRHTLLLTGTPVQNNTEELWPLLNYIEPVRFCDLDAFKVEFGELQTNEQVTRLTTLLRPHLLRRVKEDVAGSIPPLEETIIDVELTMIQKAYYKAIFERNKNFLFKNARKGQQLPSLMNIEMELRKCCNHPFMIQGVEEREYATCKNEAEKYKKLVESSGKLVLLTKLLPKLKIEGHKVLIFSQFQNTLTLIQEFLIYQNWEFERLDGQVKGTERATAIARFNDSSLNKFVFLLSTRAGGLGINLTSADTVIIFDSDWNPQNDVQATARAHRIGQEREVKVYRLVTARTYESDMFDRASKKLGLNTAVFHRGAFDSKTRKDKSVGSDEVTGINAAKAPSKEEIEELLKRGAFYLLEGSAEAARQFQEGDIDEILSKKSRLVRYQLTGMSSSFAKTSFRSDKASDLSLDDPDFWQKVLNDSSSRRLLARLNDGSATENHEAMEEFMNDLQAAVEGIAAEDDPEPVIEALVQMSNLTTFSQEHRQQAESWLARVNANLEVLGEGPSATASTAGDKGSSPAGTSTTGDAVDHDEDGKPVRRSARVSKLDSQGNFLPEDPLKWIVEDDPQTKGNRKRGRRAARRSEISVEMEDHLIGGLRIAGTSDSQQLSEDELDEKGTTEIKKFQRRLATKFAEQGERRVFTAALDDVLSESPSSNDEDDDDRLDDHSRSKKRLRTSSTKGKTRATGTGGIIARAKRKPRRAKSTSIIEAGEFDPETVAAAIAAGVDISDETAALKKSRKSRTSTTGVKRKRSFRTGDGGDTDPKSPVKKKRTPRKKAGIDDEAIALTDSTALDIATAQNVTPTGEMASKTDNPATSDANKTSLLIDDSEPLQLSINPSFLGGVQCSTSRNTNNEMDNAVLTSSPAKRASPPIQPSIPVKDGAGIMNSRDSSSHENPAQDASGGKAVSISYSKEPIPVINRDDALLEKRMKLAQTVPLSSALSASGPATTETEVLLCCDVASQPDSDRTSSLPAPLQSTDFRRLSYQSDCVPFETSNERSV